MIKKVTIILFLLISIMLIFFLAYKDIIYQEGDPLPVIKGIIQLNSKSYAKISDDPIKFITKTNDKNELFDYIEKENNVKFEEQLGAGYIFDGPEKNVILISNQYTRFYQVWKYAETKKDKTEQIEKLINDFGKKLQSVSLLAPEDVLAASMDENYKEYLTPELLTKWKQDPQDALGRLVSSPWLDRIEILKTIKINDSEYTVIAEIMEITSVEAGTDKIAAKRPVNLKVKDFEGKYLIEDGVAGNYEEANSILYINEEYGFVFPLPESWKNFSIVKSQWEGIPLDSSDPDKNKINGPIINIRHPKWTAENMHQDIPIMIFTHEQWQLIENEKLSLGAAPIPPSELGRNKSYIFALPARYNYAFLEGFEEVEKILLNNPLLAFDID